MARSLWAVHIPIYIKKGPILSPKYYKSLPSNYRALWRRTQPILNSCTIGVRQELGPYDIHQHLKRLGTGAKKQTRLVCIETNRENGKQCTFPIRMARRPTSLNWNFARASELAPPLWVPQAIRMCALGLLWERATTVSNTVWDIISVMTPKKAVTVLEAGLSTASESTHLSCDLLQPCLL